MAVKRDPRYDREAYGFLREALDHTIRARKARARSRKERHVRGPELLDGFRELALDQFGPMTMTVMEEWGVRRTEDVGHMVFNLIEVGAFGRTDEDSLDDFCGGFDFREAFVAPFEPGVRAS